MSIRLVRKMSAVALGAALVALTASTAIGAEPSQGAGEVSEAEESDRAKPDKTKEGAIEAEDLVPRALAILGGDAQVVLATRYRTYDHWYANFGYYMWMPEKMLYGKPGGQLVLLSLRSGERKVLLDDPQGSVRDPHVHYDGRTILFSYRKGGTHHYNLYEIQADGSALRQITNGPFDDIEPIYLPNDGIVFISSRCNRWVPCWTTQVGIMYRCDRQGGGMRALSSNVEHENTPWMLPDGRVLYMRWEYTSRVTTQFHGLWTVNPDGTGAATYYGNMHPGDVMIDAKPVPGTRDVACIFSWSHGYEEHRGGLVVVKPDGGPDDLGAVRVIGPGAAWRDPYPLAKDLFLLAKQGQLLLMDDRGRWQKVLSLPEKEPFGGDDSPVCYKPNAVIAKEKRFHRAGCPHATSDLIWTTLKEPRDKGWVPCWLCEDGPWVNEPRPLRPRAREPIIPDRVDPKATTGRLLLTDVTRGRNMTGVKAGEIKQLLVLEELPQPYGYNDAQGLTRALTVRRVLGTVPVEGDGSAYFEVPAMHSLYFVALDERGRGVKVMQSFLTVMPGETIGCIGCHEYRTEPGRVPTFLASLKSRPNLPQRPEGVPDIIHFPRDIQPILDRHCVKCHGFDSTTPPAGGVALAGDRAVGAFTHAYGALFAKNQIAFDRKGSGNNPPHSLGTGTSLIMNKLDGSHHEVKLSAEERLLMHWWVDSDAQFAGTAAWKVSEWTEDRLVGELFDGSVSKVYSQRGCTGCHSIQPDKGRGNYSRFSSGGMYNLSRPEKSRVLLAPLAREAGGWDVCRPVEKGQTKKGVASSSTLPPTEHKPVFASREDPDYQKLLAAVRAVKERLDQRTTPDMPNYRPDAEYVREMKRYGILPPTFDLAKDPIDVFAVDRKYWESFWPVSAGP